MKLVTAASIIVLLSNANEAVAFTAPATRRGFAATSSLSMSKDLNDESSPISRREALVQTLSAAVVLSTVGSSSAANAADLDFIMPEPMMKAGGGMPKSSSKTYTPKSSPFTTISTATTATAKKPVSVTEVDPKGSLMFALILAGAGGLAFKNMPIADTPTTTSKKVDEEVIVAPETEASVEESQVVEMKTAIKESPAPKKSPYIKPVEEFCEPGAVDENCTDSIKSYVENAEVTGATVSAEEARTIVSYLDSLSSAASSAVSNFATEGKSKNTVGFASYLDNLSVGSNTSLSGSSASVIKGYLDNLDGHTTEANRYGADVVSGVADVAEVSAVNSYEADSIESSEASGFEVTKSAGGFGSYLDNLSAGSKSSLSGSSASAMKSYLDHLNGHVNVANGYEANGAADASYAADHSDGVNGGNSADVYSSAGGATTEIHLPNGKSVTVAVETIVEKKTGMGGYLESMSSNSEKAPVLAGKGMGGYLDSMSSSSSNSPSGKGFGGYLDAL